MDDSDLSEGSWSGDEFNSDTGEDQDNGVEQRATEPKKVKGLKHLLALKSSLGLAELNDKATLKREKRRRQKERKRLKKIELKGQGDNSDIKKITTLATKHSSKAAKIQPEVVVYSDPKKRNKTSNSGNNANSKIKAKRPERSGDTNDEVTMKQARFDVFKFGIKALDREGQHEARVALAIRLGAKPEKNKCIPYAELKEQRKTRKEETKRQREMDRVTGNLKVSARPMSVQSKKSSKQAKGLPQKDKKKSKQNEKIPLKLGKFDGGTLRLSKKDLSKVK